MKRCKLCRSTTKRYNGICSSCAFGDDIFHTGEVCQVCKARPTNGKDSGKCAICEHDEWLAKHPEGEFSLVNYKTYSRR